MSEELEWVYETVVGHRRVTVYGEPGYAFHLYDEWEKVEVPHIIDVVDIGSWLRVAQGISAANSGGGDTLRSSCVLRFKNWEMA